MTDKNAIVICPISLLEAFSTRHHLVLVQYWHLASYRRFYLKCRARGDFIIQDNGAAELKEALDEGGLIDMARELRPTLIVAPDTIYDKSATLSATASFLYRQWPTLRDLGIKVMAVPQGKTPQEWMECYEVFNADPRIDWLGISMFYTPKFNRRLEVLRAIAPTIRKSCHLLGLWNNPFDLLMEREFDFVKSVDTAKAIEFAIEGLTLGQWDRHKHIDDDWYFKTAGKVFGPDANGTWELMQHNVRSYIRLFEAGIYTGFGETTLGDTPIGLDEGKGE